MFKNVSIVSAIQIILRYLHNQTVGHINPVHSFLIRFNTELPYVKRPYHIALYRQYFEYIYNLFMPTYKMTWKKKGVSDITVNC